MNATLVIFCNTLEEDPSTSAALSGNSSEVIAVVMRIAETG